jgi:ketosteroid isomerase-like protein
MTQQYLTIGLLSALLGLFGCDSKTDNKTFQTQTKSQEMTVTVETLKEILEAFNRHDLDAIMEFFSDDCSFDFPRDLSPGDNASLARHKCGKHLPVVSKEFLMFTIANGKITRKDSYWKIVE